MLDQLCFEVPLFDQRDPAIAPYLTMCHRSRIHGLLDGYMLAKRIRHGSPWESWNGQSQNKWHHTDALWHTRNHLYRYLNVHWDNYPYDYDMLRVCAHLKKAYIYVWAGCCILSTFQKSSAWKVTFTYPHMLALSLSLSICMRISNVEFGERLEDNKSLRSLCGFPGCMKLTYVVWACSIEISPKASQMRVATSLGVDFVDARRRCWLGW